MTDLVDYALMLALWLAIIVLVYQNSYLTAVIRRKDANIKFWKAMAEEYEAKLDEALWRVDHD